jgi:hypothetical protein
VAKIAGVSCGSKVIEYSMGKKTRQGVRDFFWASLIVIEEGFTNVQRKPPFPVIGKRG